MTDHDRKLADGALRRLGVESSSPVVVLDYATGKALLARVRELGQACRQAGGLLDHLLADLNIVLTVQWVQDIETMRKNLLTASEDKP